MELPNLRLACRRARTGQASQEAGMDVLVVSDHSSRADIEQAIAALRTKAKRYSRKDPRRDEIDVEVDRLVEGWIAAQR